MAAGEFANSGFVGDVVLKADGASVLGEMVTMEVRMDSRGDGGRRCGCSCGDCGFGKGVRVVRVRVERHLIEDFLGYGQALDAQRFQVHFAIRDACLQLVAPSALDPVHGAACRADDENQKSEHDEEEYPETRQSACTL